jgi:hypothetical protein
MTKDLPVLRIYISQYNSSLTHASRKFRRQYWAPPAVLSTGNGGLKNVPASLVDRMKRISRAEIRDHGQSFLTGDSRQNGR